MWRSPLFKVVGTVSSALAGSIVRTFLELGSVVQDDIFHSTQHSPIILSYGGPAK
jgi:hypothetical protein